MKPFGKMVKKVIKSFARRKKLVIVITLILVTAGVLGGWRIWRQQAQRPGYQTAKVERGTIVSTINASGKVLPANMIDVTTNASGAVKKVYVKDGERVVAGQRIAELTLDLAGQQKNSSAWSNYLSAKNSVDAAFATFYSLQSAMFVANQKFINDAVARDLDTDNPVYIEENADWLAAEAKYKNQTAVVGQLKSSLNNLWLSYQLTSAVITAPVSGTVTGMEMVEGLVLGNSGQTAGSGQRVAVIQGEANSLLALNLTEVDVPKVKVGQEATITLDSLPDQIFTGKVATVDKIGTTSNNVTNYTVIIQFDTNLAAILPNMAVNANIVVESKSDVLLVPSTAVQTRGKESFVRILRGGRERRTAVRLGISGDAQTEVISGLSEGDEVITGTTTGISVEQRGSVFSPFGGGALRPGGFGGGQRR